MTETCFTTFGCGEVIKQEEKYTCSLNGQKYAISPHFSEGISFCNRCNQRIIEDILRLEPIFLDLIICKEDDFEVDWNSYWKNFKIIFPRMDYNDESIDRYNNFIFLLICLGIYTREESGIWRVKNDYYNPHDYLGYVFFLRKQDIIDFIAYRFINEPFHMNVDTGVEFVSESVSKEEINSYLDELRNNKE
ncbi:MAG: hypothetical protein PHW52_00285 [Candidatus Pacebacteria bacterium]|nr:hypothetical protein [Candidatus Paceibacterota bacterium]